jgi:mannosyltransferase
MSSPTVTPSLRKPDEIAPNDGFPSTLLDKILDQIQSLATTWGMLALVVYAVIRSLICSYRKPLWFDELLVRIVCHQAGLAGIWNALRDGVDGQPPPYYLIERCASWLFSNEQIGYRLPSVLGLAGILIFLYCFVKTRSGALVALLCALLVLITPLFTMFPVEARPYSLVAACVALAMVCYQRAAEPRWVIGLFGSLFLACSLHYYAVLAVGPFVLAELAVVLLNRRIRYGVWTALTLATTPLVIYWPLLMRMKSLWGEHFHAEPATLHAVSAAYGSSFRVESPWGSALAGVAILTIIVTLVQHRERLDETQATKRVPIPELILVLGLVLLPVLGFVAAKITHGPFLARYFLPTILGMIATVGFVLGQVKVKGVAATGVFVLLAVASQEVGVWGSGLRVFGSPGSETNEISSLSEYAKKENLPIVISDAGNYVEFVSYAPASLRENVFALTDPASATVYAGTDTLDKLVLALRSYSITGVENYATFAAAHPAFLLCSNGSRFDWWPARLAHDGAGLQLLTVQGDYKVYRVEISRKERQTH